MRRTFVLAGVLVLAGCSSSTSKPDAAPSPQAAVGTTNKAPGKTPAVASSSPSSPACNLKSAGDIIVRYVVPGGPTTAQELGGVNLALCEPTFKTLADISPTDAGYCTTAAWMKDNVGYDPDAVPSPPLKKIQAQAGQGCG